jgi:stage II sporulation protein AA (anti-sigma F factor antagonist)
MDSSGIGLVMGRYKLMKDLSGTVIIENAPKSIKKVMRMAGIEKLLSEKKGREVLL